MKRRLLKCFGPTVERRRHKLALQYVLSCLHRIPNNNAIRLNNQTLALQRILNRPVNNKFVFTSHLS